MLSRVGRGGEARERDKKQVLLYGNIRKENLLQRFGENERNRRRGLLIS